jgi:hypothetical protein
MNDEPRDILIKLISKHEISSFQDSNQFHNILNDYFKGHFKKESRMLTESFKENIPNDLIAKKDSLPYEIISPQLVQRLVNVGFASDLARWAVDSWALSLGVIKEDDLTSKTGILFITSNPLDAEIIFNNKNWGKTPKELINISPGNFEVKILLNGYETWENIVDIPYGKKITINADLIKKRISLGEIFIDSSPQGAIILINSHHYGTMPKNVKGLSEGVYQINLNLEGYKKVIKNITIKPGKNTDLIEKLIPVKPTTGQIVIDSYPPNADIYLDSTNVGQTPSVLKNISLGTYRLTIKLHNYNDFSTIITIKSGINPDIFGNLRTPFVIRRKIKWKTYGTIVLIAAAAIFFVFFGHIQIPNFISQSTNNNQPIPTNIPTQNLESNAIFLSEGE